MKVTRFALLSLGGVMFAAMGCYSPPPRPRPVYIVAAGPPADVVEVVPAQPGPEYVWVAGHYRWDSERYVWFAGHWAQPPAGFHEWVAGHWGRREGGWVWVEGHWR